jgi:hypothetical protein
LHVDKERCYPHFLLYISLLSTFIEQSVFVSFVAVLRATLTTPRPLIICCHFETLLLC